MSRTYWHRHRRKIYKSPRWFTNMLIVRPERQQVRLQARQAVNGPRSDLDLFVWPQGNKPNADWEWS